MYPHSLEIEQLFDEDTRLVYFRLTLLRLPRIQVACPITSATRV